MTPKVQETVTGAAEAVARFFMVGARLVSGDIVWHGHYGTPETFAAFRASIERQGRTLVPFKVACLEAA